MDFEMVYMREILSYKTKDKFMDSILKSLLEVLHKLVIEHSAYLQDALKQASCAESTE